MSDFEGRCLLLTGASGGIGKAIAELFHEKGASLVLADRDQAAVEALARKLDPGGERVAAMAMDAARPEDARRAVELAMERFGRLDHLIPGAAIYEEQPFAAMTDEQWRRTMAINVDGVFYLCRDALAVMKPGSSMVLIASDAADQGATPGHAHYGTSKGAVIGLMRSLARELAPDIRVNAISPGTINTPMVGDLLKTWGERLMAGIPMQRLGSPREVAEVAAFLCGEGGAYMTGQALHPNGGSFIGA
ncbi:MAG: SDR family NAD(P)-dependent oxidoreductase [Parvibaculaceae bacterium]